jgi:hypothetical protein
LYGSKHRFVVAAELMQAGRTYAFNVSVIHPRWIEEINPDAARIWHITRDKRQAEPARTVAAEPKPEPPKQITLGDVTLKTAERHGKIYIEIPWAAVEKLRALPDFALPKEARKWRAHVVTPVGPYLRDRLPVVLKLLRYATLPTQMPDDDVPIGALLEADRNLHTLERYLPRLLEPTKIPRQHTGGFLALVSNGGGGFWYDSIENFIEAVSVSLAALQGLLDAGNVVDILRPQIDRHIAGFEEILRDLSGSQ